MARWSKGLLLAKMIYIDKTVKSRKLVLLDKMAYPVKTLLLDEMIQQV